MFKVPFIASFILGSVLLVHAFKAADSNTSLINRTISGTSSNESLLLVTLGGTAVVAGGLGLLLSRNA